MSTFKSRGIVINEKNFGDSDKILTILFKDVGKLSVYAKGSRKPNSKFFAAAQVFSYSDFVIYTGNGFYSIASCQIINTFMSKLFDIERIYYGSYFLEVTEKIIYENSDSNDMMLVLLYAINALCNERLYPKCISLIFELKVLELQGVSPSIDVCVKCGKKTRSEFINPILGGILCEKCNSYEFEKDTMHFSSSAYNAILYILSNENKIIFKLNFLESLYIELNKIVNNFFKVQIGEFNSIKFLYKL